MKPSTLKLIRQTHLYFGVFISPAILFFAFTGALQTFSLHETTKGSDYKPPAWAVTLGQIHKHQGVIPQPPPAPPKSAAAATDLSAAPPMPAPKAVPPGKSHKAMKFFFLVVCIGLFTSTITGLIMSYKYSRNKLYVIGALVAGIVIPAVLLFF